MIIRLAQQSDLPQVNAIRRQVHEVHAQGRPDIFHPEFGGALESHIDEIFGVDAACRRQGIGTRLFDFIKQYAAENGFDTIELDMWEFNEVALPFYESVGFRTYRRYMEYKA